MSAAPISFVFQTQGTQQVKQEIQGLGGAFNNFGQQAETVNKQTAKLTPNFKQAALGMTAAATSATALFFQYDNLEKVQQRVEKAEVTLSSARATLASSQVSLNNLVEKGVTSGDQYQAAVLRLQSAQERLTVATKDVELAQGDMQESQLQFALSVVPTTITTVTTLTTTFKGFNFTNLATRLGLMQTKGEALMLTPALGGVGASGNVASLGMRNLAMGIKTVMLSLGPIGIAILGVSTFMGLFATNAFGMRTAINQAGEAIGNAIPVLKPLLDMLGSLANALFPEATDQATNMQQGMSGQFQQVGYSANQMQAGLGDSFSQVNAASSGMTTEVSNQVAVLASNFDDSADKIVSDAKRMKDAMKEVGVSRSNLEKQIFAGSESAGGGVMLGSMSGQQVKDMFTAKNFNEVPNPLGGTLLVSKERGIQNLFPTAPSGTQFASKNSASNFINITINGDVSGEEIVDKVNRGLSRYMLEIT